MGERRPTCPFVTLGIEHGADETAAKRAHRALMLGGAHPDRGGDPVRAQELGGALQLITEGKAFARGGCDCSGRTGRASADPFEGWDPFRRYQPSADFRRPRQRPGTWREEDEAERRARAERVREEAERNERARAQAAAERRARRPSGSTWETRAHEEREREAARGAQADAERRRQEERDDIWDQVMRAHRERQAREAEEVEAARVKANAERARRAYSPGFDTSWSAKSWDSEAERSERERRNEREQARARQDQQNARAGANYQRPGKPIYQPGAARPPKAVRDLFERAKKTEPDDETPF